ncbi:MAG: hypothetical protein V7L29_03625 [Nostoc sp.]|uniref:hypothetical protein n=1 Tax=Nostoc sp. TaxID=1180 RepID=UPI002FF79B47
MLDRSCSELGSSTFLLGRSCSELKTPSSELELRLFIIKRSPLTLHLSLVLQQAISTTSYAYAFSHGGAIAFLTMESSGKCLYMENPNKGDYISCNCEAYAVISNPQKICTISIFEFFQIAEFIQTGIARNFLKNKGFH